MPMTEEQKLRKKEYNKLYGKVYRSNLEYKKKFNNYQKKYRLNHPELIKKHKEYQEKYRLNIINKKKHSEFQKIYMLISEHKIKRNINHKKNKARRNRNFDYNLLNPIFKACNGHHIDKTNVINIPETLHKAVPHRQNNNEQMKQINILAWSFMESNSY